MMHSPPLSGHHLPALTPCVLRPRSPTRQCCAACAPEEGVMHCTALARLSLVKSEQPLTYFATARSPSLRGCAATSAAPKKMNCDSPPGPPDPSPVCIPPVCSPQPICSPLMYYPCPRTPARHCSCVSVRPLNSPPWACRPPPGHQCPSHWRSCPCPSGWQRCR